MSMRGKFYEVRITTDVHGRPQTKVDFRGSKRVKQGSYEVRIIPGVYGRPQAKVRFRGSKSVKQGQWWKADLVDERRTEPVRIKPKPLRTELRSVATPLDLVEEIEQLLKYGVSASYMQECWANKHERKQSRTGKHYKNRKKPKPPEPPTVRDVLAKIRGTVDVG